MSICNTTRWLACNDINSTYIAKMLSIYTCMVCVNAWLATLNSYSLYDEFSTVSPIVICECRSGIDQYRPLNIGLSENFNIGASLITLLSLVHTSNSISDFSPPAKCDRMNDMQNERIVYFRKATPHFCVQVHSFASVRNAKSPTKLPVWTMQA
jgi:hypothetical protein